MRTRIGIFDSGFGGLSVLQRIYERHSNFDGIYLADTARVPYGSKEVDEIREIAFEITNWFGCQKIDALVVACNTTNSLAVDLVKSFSKVPVFDLIGALSELLSESRIGVLATSSTVASKAYTKQILSFNPFAVVFEEACPEFVPMIEKGNLDSTELMEIAQLHIEPLLKQNVEAIVLGCSHYPLIKDVFFQLIPPHIRIVDPAIGLAMKMDSFFPTAFSCSNNPTSSSDMQFCVTADPLRFSSIGLKFLGERPGVEVISLRSKACVF